MRINARFPFGHSGRVAHPSRRSAGQHPSRNSALPQTPIKIDIRWVEIEGSADQALSEGKADMYPMTITSERESLLYMSAPW
jgi:hypothetical protein